MDKEEAIKRIKDHIRVHHIGEYPHILIAEALGMAISALATDTNVGDKVEVVRCKDCKQYNGHRYCYYFAQTVLDNDFCSYGERRDSE